MPGRTGALLVVGDVATDVIARHPGALARGTDTAAEVRTLPGGAGANAACWAAYSGCPDVRLLGRVGAGTADRHEALLRGSGVHPVLVRDQEVPTATIVALVDAEAERTFLTDGGAALRLCPGDWSARLLDGVARLHLSGYLFFSEPSRELACLALADALGRGVPVSVDPASAGFIADFGVDRFLGATAGTGVLLPNADEARLLTGLPDAADAAARLSRRVPLVAVTLGAGGALVAQSGAVTDRIAAVPAAPVDSTGAGDAFTGAFLAALLADATPAAAASAGCRAGARAVAVRGGRPPDSTTAPP
ncbi:carbohydrate kinase family protein [Streptomyces pacificus]|uniref:Sugar kinase n=1 Tax=Streptomyces pacificus TaxID=2705029 RepID=A0A6A0AQE1_9ACTN|nr:PfkB family carbohydrate kinase [Streptomyces pacificus]GFH35219.1 sugar kinase [Streptomyces pacificus]